MERKKQKEEAIERLKILDLVTDIVLEDFENEDRIYISERSPLVATLIPLDNRPEWVEKVRQVEEEYDVLVYHATHEMTEFGELLTLFYVSKYEDEWEQDKKDLSAKDEYGQFIFIAYVLNLSCPEFSEFGSVGMQKLYHGLMRTA